MSPQEVALLKFFVGIIMFVVLITTLRYEKLSHKIADTVLSLSGLAYVTLLYILFANVPDKEFGGYLGTVILVGIAFIPFTYVVTAHKLRC
jgi:hypothetical protein